MPDEIDLSAGFIDEPPPRRRTSGVRRFQPTSDWSLDKLPEIETEFLRSQGRSLPVSVRGQGRIHNKWGYQHENSADVGLNPNSKEGQAFIQILERRQTPYLAFDRAIPGVATGPHIHVGRPSRRGGARTVSQKPADSGIDLSAGIEKPDEIDLSAGLIGEPASAPVRTRTLPPRTRKPQLSEFDRAVQEARAATRKVLGPETVDAGEGYSTPSRITQPQPIRRRSSLAQMATALPGVHQILNFLPEEDRENLVEGATGAVAGTIKQLANTQDLGMTITGMDAVPGLNRLRAVPRALRRASEGVAETIPENQALRPAPTTFAGEVRRGIGQGVGAATVELPKLITGGRFLGAANLPVFGALSRADEGVPGLVKGAAGGLVYHYGGRLTGQYLGKIGNSLVWIAGPTAERTLIGGERLGKSLGESIPMGVFAGATGSKVRIKTRGGERDATDADLPRILKKEVEVVAPERIEDARPEPSGDIRAETERPIYNSREPQATTPQRFQHVDFGEVQVAADQTGARSGRIKVAEVTDPSKIHYVKKSDMQGRGNARMIPLREPAEQAAAPAIELQSEAAGSAKLAAPALEKAGGEKQNIGSGVSTATEISKAQNFGGQQHLTAKYLEGSGLKDKVVAALPEGSVLFGPNAEAREMQYGALRLRSPKGEIWEVDNADAHPNDPNWTVIGSKRDGFAVRNTGVVEPDLVSESASPSRAFPVESEIKVDRPAIAGEGISNAPNMSSVLENRGMGRRPLATDTRTRSAPDAETKKVGQSGTSEVKSNYESTTIDASVRSDTVPAVVGVQEAATLGGRPVEAELQRPVTALETASVSRRRPLPTVEEPKLTDLVAEAPSGKVINLDDPVPPDVLRIINSTFNKTVGPDIYSELPKNPKTQDVIELMADLGLSDQIMQQSAAALRKAGYSRIGDVIITEEGLRHANPEIQREIEAEQQRFNDEIRARYSPQPEQPSTQQVGASPLSRSVERPSVREPEIKRERGRNVTTALQTQNIPVVAETSGRGRGDVAAPIKARTRGERLVTGERSDMSLSQFVRSRGGIVPHEMFEGELNRLRSPDTGTTGLINRHNVRGGQKMIADRMMEAANEAGFKDPQTGEPFENVGNFLYAVERDVSTKNVKALTGAEIDFEKEYRKHTETQIADEAERVNAQKSADALVTLLESGRGGELFDKIVTHDATRAEQAEFRTLLRRRFIRNSDVEDLIREAQAESVSTSFESERAPRRAEQIGFTQEGLEQQTVQPKRDTAKRERLEAEEKARQRATNPERAAAMDTLADLRSKGMTVDDYVRQGSLLGEAPTRERLQLLRELESGTKPIESQQPELIPEPLEALRRRGRVGEAGFATVRGGRRAPTPILAEVERATQSAEQKPSIRSRVSRIPSRLQTAFTSQFTPLRRLEAQLYGNRRVPVVDIARKFEQVAGAPGKAEADVIEFRRAVVDPIKNQADDFNSYLFLKRVHDRLSKDPDRKRVADWSIEKAEQGLAELKAKVGADTMKQFAAQGKIYQEQMRKALQLQVESGRMSQELYDKIVSENDFYAPFKVLAHIEQAQGVSGTGSQIATTQALSKKITGIDSTDFQLGNILQASAEQIVRSRVLAEKNFKMLELDKLADVDPTGDLIRRVSPDSKPKRGYEQVKFFKDGKGTILEVEREVAQAVQGLNPAQTSILAKPMIVARAALRGGATTFNTGFQAVNLFFADLPRAAMVSRYGLRSPRDIYQFPIDWGYSLFTSMRGNFGRPNQLYTDWLRSGAANSTIQRELTPDVFKPPPLGMVGRRPAKAVLDSVAKFSNAIEETSKVLGIRRGMRIEQISKLPRGEQQAAMEKIAAEVRNYSGSPDFARKGTETRSLNLLFMFFNARLQGISADAARLAGKTGKPEAVAAWARLGTMIGIPTTILALVNNLPQYRDDYQQIPEWERQNYWMIPRESFFINEDTDERVRDYWRIPKRELGKLFANTIESAVHFGIERDPQTAQKWAVSMVENISPINIEGRTLRERGESVIGSTNPLFKVPTEVATNRDFFRHKPIIPQYMEKAEPAEQYRASTPRSFVEFGRRTGVSPLIAEHVAQGATGGSLGQFTVRQPQPGRAAAVQYPLVRRFVRSGATSEDSGLGERISTAERAQATEQVVRRRTAMQLLSAMKGLSDSEVEEQIAAIGDKALAEKVKDIRKEMQRGLTYIDKRIAALGVESGARERFLRGEIQRKSPEEGEVFLDELERKGLIESDERKPRQARGARQSRGTQRRLTRQSLSP